MPAPIMCGVVSMAAASDCAGKTLSSNVIFAFFVPQSTVTDWTPFTRLNEPCTVLVQGGQWRPVTKKVALVGSAEYSRSAVTNPVATANEATMGQRMVVLQVVAGVKACARRVAGRTEKRRSPSTAAIRKHLES